MSEPSAVAREAAAVAVRACFHVGHPFGYAGASCHWCIAGARDTFAAARVAEERGEIMEWLAHRCDYGPPCNRCTYCSVRRWIGARAPEGAQP